VSANKALRKTSGPKKDKQVSNLGYYITGKFVICTDHPVLLEQ
jgi:hypothetical protein